MLKELSRHENLGSPKYFYELFARLADNKKLWSVQNLNQHFYNRVVDGAAVFDGCVPFARAVGAIMVDEKGVVSLNNALASALVSEKFLAYRLLELAFAALRSDEVFQEIFCAGNMSYDVVYRRIQIENGAFKFKYANFRHFLIRFEFLQPHPDSGIRKLIVNNRYRKLFDRDLLPEIKKRKIGIEQLEAILAKQQLYGKEAEAFVLKYEQKRLALHERNDAIEIISEYDAGAGYDIISFESQDSKTHDRFIEVKSFEGNPRFHWSRNEMDVARVQKDKYFLYLVDRNQMQKDSYSPIMINNPHERILNNPAQWEKSVDAYLITQVANDNSRASMKTSGDGQIL